MKGRHVTEYFSVVIKEEPNGTFSAWVTGLPGVYAAADTRAAAKRSIRDALAAHLETADKRGRSPKLRTELLVLRKRNHDLAFTGLGALLGRKTSKAKARAARLNGLKGGRPRISTQLDSHQAAAIPKARARSHQHRRRP